MDRDEPLDPGLCNSEWTLWSPEGIQDPSDVASQLVYNRGSSNERELMNSMLVWKEAERTKRPVPLKKHFTCVLLSLYWHLNIFVISFFLQMGF